MISREKWHRRSTYGLNDCCDIPSPCKCCPDKMICNRGPPVPVCADGLFLAKIQAAHRHGWYSAVGYPQCLRLNYWVLGLDYRGVRE